MSKLKTLFERLEARIAEKNTAVTDIREAYDSLDRAGAKAAICKEVVKWRKKGLAAYEAHTVAVAQMLVEVEGLQLDFFQKAAEPMDLIPKAPKAEAGEEIGQDDIEVIGPAEETMRPIGEVAEKVVETVAEMRRKDQAEEAIPPFLRGQDEPTPDEQAQAKLEGEIAGSKGASPTANPYPAASSLNLWWCRGFHPAAAEWDKKNPTVTKIPGSKISAKFTDEVVTRGKGPQSGFKDKTPRVGASAAAKMLGQPASE